MEGKLIRLRGYERSDIDALMRWMTDDEVIAQLGPTQLPQTRAFQERQIEDMIRPDSPQKVFVIETLKGEAIGEVGLRNFDWVSRSAELIITIGEKRYWGKGCGTEAVSMMLAIAFDRLNLHRVHLTALASNARAIRCYEKCGFERQGLFRESSYVGGRFVDVVPMGILRADYDSRHKRGGAP